MIDDPIVEEVHYIREELATRFRNDLRAYFQHLRTLEIKMQDKVVVFSESPITRNGTHAQKKAG
jgi:hypothetical protein